MPGRTYENPEYSGTNSYRYAFNGKEHDSDGEFGSLTHYDFGFRVYNPSIGRFLSNDPRFEMYPDMSPYNYVGNNPINAIDIKGDSISPIVSKIVGDDNQGLITNATPNLRENSPFLAGLQDGSHFILSMLGVNLVDDLIFGSDPTSDRIANAAGQILTPGPTKGVKPTVNSNTSTLKPGQYAKESIKTNSTTQKFNKSQRQEINRIGNESGCHTCGSKDPGTKSGNFVPDHQPVGVLNPNYKEFDLFPHCITCSRSQGGIVSQIIKKKKNGT